MSYPAGCLEGANSASLPKYPYCVHQFLFIRFHPSTSLTFISAFHEAVIHVDSLPVYTYIGVL